jgi:peptidoglycan/xylan/chitin deacetylase (PgdA/CDA1 family)
MQIFLTYDYELFFGNPTGTAEKCIIEPTNQLRAISDRTGVKMVFFIDTGYLKKLIEFKDQFEKVRLEHDQVIGQIKSLIAEGHDCQLHIHPHWEDCSHNGTEWQMKTERYKLDDFSDQEIIDIVKENKSILESITNKNVSSYRAGGWCLQPFNRVQKVFEEIGIKLDSTVFPDGKFTAGNYYYDFTNSPKKSKWKFSSDLIKEDENGTFWEYPISNHKYGPLFFWRLFILGRLKPLQHKPIGNGYPMSSPGLRKKMLTKGMNLSASADGYFVTKLNTVLKRNIKKNYEEMVIIGHPKANTLYAIKQLEKFINVNKAIHEFKTFSDLNIQ